MVLRAQATFLKALGCNFRSHSSIPVIPILNAYHATLCITILETNFYHYSTLLEPFGPSPCLAQI
jgi:hypothetical protein